MADIMNYMVGNADIGEELTSFLSDEDEDEIDSEDDENMYMLYDDEPPSYDVVSRLKEVNEALQKEIIPADYEDRNRKVTFQDNPVYLEIFCFNGYSDEEDDGCEDNEKKVDDDDDYDDGYGDSTEASEEMQEDNCTEHEQSDKVKAETLDVNSHHNTEKCSDMNVSASEPSDDVETGNNDAQCENFGNLPTPTVTDAIEPVFEPLKSENPHVVEFESTEKSNQIEETVIKSDEKISQSEIVQINMVEKTEISLPKGDVSTANVNQRPKSSKVANNQKLKDTNSVTSSNSNTNAAKVPKKKPIKIRPRSSSVPPRGSNKSEEVSMIMATKGKFHMMTTDDIQVTKRATSSAPLRSSRSTESRKLNLSDIFTAESVDSNDKSIPIPKLDSKTCKLNNRNARPFTTEAKTKTSAPDKLSMSVIGRPATIRPKYQGDGPSRYGLTAEQKREKKLLARSLNQNQQEKQQETILEQKRKKEQVDEAYRLWLQRKKSQQLNEVKVGEDVKNEQGNDRGKSLRPISRPSFDEWLLLKRNQKKKDEEIERMKRKVEMDISYVKTAEQNNRQNINKYKSKH
ncbi:hypothetical protein CHUAL_001146 [Chamberlinius hualienensis]